MKETKNRVIFPYERMSGEITTEGEGGETPYIKLIIDNIEFFEGTLTDEQLEIIQKDNAYVVVENDGIIAHCVKQLSSGNLIIFQAFSGTSPLILDIDTSNKKYTGEMMFSLASITINGTDVPQFNDQAQIKLKSINGNSVVGEGNITIAQSSIVTISGTPTATQGTLTLSQLTTLQANDFNIIEFNNEVYTLMDKGHTAGYLTYSHVGIENSLIYIKTFTITVSTRAWVLNVRVVPEIEYDESTKTLNIIG